MSNGVPELRQFRIVLLGKTGSGKSSSGNTILGREVRCFETDNSPLSVTQTCDLQNVVIGEMLISIIDTPGLFDTSITEDQVKEEIEKCIEMSVPGPHAFLLVIRLDVKYTEEEKNTVKWIQKNFGECAANYTIILFTHADTLKNKTLDEYINKSNDLQTLIDSCGGRYHSFNNENMENRYQVTELLEKIEEMVERNGGQHYTDEMYREAQRKIQKRAQFWFDTPRIVLLGKTGSGKSSTGNTILDRDAFRVTDSQQSTTKTCEKQEGTEADKNISIIDTPGLIDSSTTEKKARSTIEDFVCMSAPGPHVFLLVIRLDVRFTEEENTVEWIQKNIGEDAVNYTIILFTHADQLEGTTVDEHIRQSPDLQRLTRACGNKYHTLNNDRTTRDQVKKLFVKIEQMAEKNGWKYYTNDIFHRILERRRKFEKIKTIAEKNGVLFGTSSMIAGGILLGVSGITLAPALITAGGAAVAVGAAGMWIYRWKKNKGADISADANNHLNDNGQH